MSLRAGGGITSRKSPKCDYMGVGNINIMIENILNHILEPISLY